MLDRVWNGWQDLIGQNYIFVAFDMWFVVPARPVDILLGYIQRKKVPFSLSIAVIEHLQVSVAWFQYLNFLTYNCLEERCGTGLGSMSKLYNNDVNDHLFVLYIAALLLQADCKSLHSFYVWWLLCYMQITSFYGAYFDLWILSSFFSISTTRQIRRGIFGEFHYLFMRTFGLPR